MVLAAHATRGEVEARGTRRESRTPVRLSPECEVWRLEEPAIRGPGTSRYGSRLLWSVLLTLLGWHGAASTIRTAAVDPNRSHGDATATEYLPDEVVAVAVKIEPDHQSTPDDIWQAVNLASTFVRHAETIAQTRFNNFLVADSLLLLAWATLFAGQRPEGSRVALYTLAGLSAVLSFFWIILGTRQRKFFELHSTHLVTLERSLPRSSWIGRPMEDLRDGGCVSINSNCVLRLGWIEKWITPTILLIIGPVVLLVISLILVGVTAFGL